METSTSHLLLCIMCVCHQVKVSGADQRGCPFSFVKEVTVSGGGRKVVCGEEPFVATVPCPSEEGGARASGGVAIEVVFHSHYGEPPLTLPVSPDQPLEMIHISFDPFTGQWSVQRDKEEVMETQ